jgi:hypothetical protein
VCIVVETPISRDADGGLICLGCTEAGGNLSRSLRDELSRLVACVGLDNIPLARCHAGLFNSSLPSEASQPVRTSLVLLTGCNVSVLRVVKKGR